MTQRISMRMAASIFTIIGVAAYLALITAQQVPQDTGQVQAAFERELNHEPGPAARVRRASIEQDELYEALNQVHWTPDAPATNTEPAQPVLTEGDSNEETYD